MKLKKIASLALAGIMAVSMLAGCKDGAKPENPVPETPVTTDVVTYANDILKGNQKAVFEFENSDDFNTALKSAATDSSKFTSQIIKKYTYYTAQGVTELNEELADKLDATNGTMTTVTSEGTEKGVYVYAVSGNVEEKAAVEMAVTSFANVTLKNNTYFPAVAANKYVLDYTANISALKVAAPDNADDTVWVIGILVNQTATESANTQA